MALVRKCDSADFEAILSVINDGARAYKGVIPTDSWHEPYMSSDELRNEIISGVVFSGYEVAGSLVGVMGVQIRDDVLLIRHAYIRLEMHRRGAGTTLLTHLTSHSVRPILIGTWAAATWALRFYEKNGFVVICGPEKNRLLSTYWDIPAPQIEASVVMGDTQALVEVVRTSNGAVDEVIVTNGDE